MHEAKDSRSPAPTLRERWDWSRAEWDAEVLDRLYLGELIRDPAPEPAAVYVAAVNHLVRLPWWRVLLARLALGSRSLDDHLN